MKSTVRILFLLFPALLCAESARLSNDKITQISQAVSTEMARSTVPGVTVAIAWSGGAEWSNGYGMADLENFVPATSLTEIRLGSISKPITAVAVMQLVEQGKIELDAPIDR